ncbi:T9SS type A sorting domain-containing protein [Reichenbachiella versicolor]|uniref:T9SS type A sorting domain-containing protein n=1 Tax=Reichenbachiella versicolor TaxID=1821036 RepID=UPI000D6E2549|nr:T9SS type A sorting domain-containing protein [Reichenbachiella versicolor]
MKTIKSTLIAILTLVSVSAFAKTGKLDETKTAALDVVIEQQKSGKVLVGFENMSTNVVKIKIYDTNGSAVYSKRIKDANLMLKRFDLSALPAGEYSYEVSSAGYSVEKTIVN